MKTYALSEEAEQDYFEAFDFISGYSQRAALAWQHRMLEAFDHLSDWPLSGMVRPAYGSASLRIWVDGDYIVLYDPKKEPLRILGILHGAQNFYSLLARRIENYEES